MMYWINDYEFTNSSAANPQGPDAMVQRPAGQTIAQPLPAPTGRDATTYLPMTSNLVAHAIQAGMITKPQQIGPWAEHAFAAAKNVVEGKQAETPPGGEDFDDDIPF